MKETSIAARLFRNLVFDITSTEQKLEFLPLGVGEFFDLVVGAPAVEDHADSIVLDRLTFAGTEFDEIGCTKLSGQQSQERRG